MEKRFKYGIALLFLLITGLGLYGYFSRLSGAPSGTIRQADAHVTALEIHHLANIDEHIFDSQYLYKVLSVSGIVQKIRQNSAGYIIFLGSLSSRQPLVSCTLDSLYLHHPPNLHTGDSCTILGTCAGRLKEVILLSGIIEK